MSVLLTTGHKSNCTITTLRSKESKQLFSLLDAAAASTENIPTDNASKANTCSVESTQFGRTFVRFNILIANKHHNERTGVLLKGQPLG